MTNQPTVVESMVYLSLDSTPSSISSFNSSGKRQRKSLTDEIELRNIHKYCKKLIKTNNHLQLALLARQKGIPQSLRYKVWPILLKYHPYVIDPYINSNFDENSNNSSHEEMASSLEKTNSANSSSSEATWSVDKTKIKLELLKYFKIRNLEDEMNVLSFNEMEVISILQSSVERFFNKWGSIVNYESAFVWIALNLAEWFPPIPNSKLVLVGKDSVNKHINEKKDESKFLIDLENLDNHLFDCSDETSEAGSELETFLSASETDIEAEAEVETESQASSPVIMNFFEIYERLVLVLLHSNEDEEIEEINGKKTKKTTLELISSNSLNKNEILFKSGKVESRSSFFLLAFAKLLPELYKSLNEEEVLHKNNQWLSWWLKYCGVKVFNKFDRGRLWDLLIGFRYPANIFEIKYKNHNNKMLKRFRKYFNNENFNLNEEENEIKFNSDTFWFQNFENSIDLKWSQIDYQLQLVFIYLSILRKNEANLLEFDQAELKEFLNNLPTEKINDIEILNSSKKQIKLNSSLIINNDFSKILYEAGELWRHWYWNEIKEENTNKNNDNNNDEDGDSNINN